MSEGFPIVKKLVNPWFLDTVPIFHERYIPLQCVRQMTSESHTKIQELCKDVIVDKKMLPPGKYNKYSRFIPVEYIETLLKQLNWLRVPMEKALPQLIITDDDRKKQQKEESSFSSSEDEDEEQEKQKEPIRRRPFVLPTSNGSCEINLIVDDDDDDEKEKDVSRKRKEREQEKEMPNISQKVSNIVRDIDYEAHVDEEIAKTKRAVAKRFAEALLNEN